jgi:hypothetical protein
MRVPVKNSIQDNEENPVLLRETGLEISSSFSQALEFTMNVTLQTKI